MQFVFDGLAASGILAVGKWETPNLSADS